MPRKKHTGFAQHVILFFFIAFASVPSTIPTGQGFAAEQVRESILSGRWYPADPDRLRNQVNAFLEQAVIAPKKGELLGLIVPHAGYVYSGQVAAHGYKLLEQHRFSTIVVIAPSHRVRFKGVSVYDRGGYRTPLGLMPLDKEFIERIKTGNPYIRYIASAHAQEHSLEIQLPFLQVVAPGSKLVPLVMGDQSYSTCQKLARTLSESSHGRDVLLIASTDLSHFHSYEKARSLDRLVIQHVRAMDFEQLSRDLDNGACEACGGGPMVTVLMATRLSDANYSTVLSALNSGDVTGDHSRVVGYMAASLWRLSGQKSSTVSANGLTGSFSREEKTLLHEITRMSIEAHLAGENIMLPEKLPPSLREVRGAFVTLRKHNRLRGCIGHIVGRLPLAETVSRMAVAAATQDPRFMPVRKEELAELEYEISVMSPLIPLKNIQHLKVGTHGVYIQRGRQAGLLLPQVAAEYGWDPVTFLEQTCHKARLPKDAWKEPGTRIYIFSAEVF